MINAEVYARACKEVTSHADYWHVHWYRDTDGKLKACHHESLRKARRCAALKIQQEEK